MHLPLIEGIIRRRILVNFRVDPVVIQAQLPARFAPKLHRGQAIAGICLIRLEQIRPRLLPAFLGIASENAAHRIAVTWRDDAGREREGVYIPRRDTGSWLNHLAGGRVFPGEHHLADFHVEDTPEKVALEMRSRDGLTHLRLRARPVETLPTPSIFANLAEVSSFFQAGSCGYSVTKGSPRLDGLSLETKTWHLEPLHVDEVHSSFFDDPALFPPGSIHFDNALLMRNIGHEWHPEPDLYV